MLIFEDYSRKILVNKTILVKFAPTLKAIKPTPIRNAPRLWPRSASRAVGGSQESRHIKAFTGALFMTD